MDLLANQEQKEPLVIKDHLDLLVYLDKEESQDQKGQKEVEEILGSQDLRDLLVKLENEDLKELQVHQANLVKQEALETLDNLDLQEKLVLLVLWEKEDHLDHKVCKDFLDPQAFLGCLVLKEIEVTQVTKDHKETQDLLVDLESLDLLDLLA